MILAFSHEGDDHTPAVLEALARRGLEARLLDVSALPARGTLALGYGQGESLGLRIDGAPPHDLSEVSALWWRRMRPMAARADLPAEEAAFAVRQTFEAVLGLVGAISSHALLVNDPWRENLAAHKTHQLAAARRVGLRVPHTLVTNDPVEAARFLEARGADGAVKKAVHATVADWHRTHRLDPGARLDGLRDAPAIFQERIPGVDVRVTVVGERLFAADIDARETPAADDYRGLEGLCRFAPCELPAVEAAKLLALVRGLGLQFATIDYRRRDDGAWFFLELNPAGQWLFVEERTGQPIAAALAALLAGA